MIPAIIVPTLTRYDLLAKLHASIDVPWERFLVIDNGGSCPPMWKTTVLNLPGNLGVGSSWNLGMKLTPDVPWWCIVNDDVVFAPGDLAALTAAMEAGEALVTLDGFSAFGISRATVQSVGYFDENFHPAYCEDADYEYRCKLAGVPIVTIPANLTHERSSTIALPEYGEQNARTYPENVRYYRRKWGGPLRGGEVFNTPFDEGGDPDEWIGSHGRRVQQGWETTALEPTGDTR